MDTNIPTKKNTPPYAPLSPPLPLSPYGAVALRIASISIYPFPYFILIKQNVLQQRCWCLFLFFLTNIENSNKQTNRVNSLSRTKDRRKSWILPFGGESRVMKRSIFGWKDEGRRTLKDMVFHLFLRYPSPTPPTETFTEIICHEIVIQTRYFVVVYSPFQKLREAWVVAFGTEISGIVCVSSVSYGSD